jgi:hypothetical protein
MLPAAQTLGCLLIGPGRPREITQKTHSVAVAEAQTLITLEAVR